MSCARVFQTTDASCTACASGTFSPGDSTGCSSHTMPSCGAGYGSITGSASADHSCEVCAAGKFSTTTDASVCSAHSAATSCPAGQDSQAGDESSDTHCEACAEGLVKEAAGTEACTKAVCTPERISHPEVAVFNQKGLNGGGVRTGPVSLSLPCLPSAPPSSNCCGSHHSNSAVNADRGRIR